MTKRDPRAALDLPRDAPVVVVAARLAREKGHKFLLEAMVSLRSEFPDAILVLAGEGNQEDALKAQAEELGIADSVRFIGFCEDVAPVLAAADISVLPSIDCTTSSSGPVM